jgi:hypothetical protein
MNEPEQTAELLFGEALDQPRDKRGAFLDSVCAGRPLLRRMVEDLLDENDRLSGFLSEPAFAKEQAAAGLASQTLVLESVQASARALPDHGQTGHRRNGRGLPGAGRKARS